MFKKISSIFYGLCVFGGLMYMFGTVGASDLELIDFETLVVRSCIGLAVMLLGYIGLKLNGCKCVN